jgi:acyl-CoA reductase-like NAD-dependent aldehyde dehydrogenase
MTGADVHVPFGGSKASGYGLQEQGSATIELYTEEITICRDS